MLPIIKLFSNIKILGKFTLRSDTSSVDAILLENEVGFVTQETEEQIALEIQEN